ncbi:PPC domain-containing DNA-binding protein [Desulfobacca acetoxidans]|uniref:PPC domain-containing protein n=1 Tax=Desulfobacca acetoxidans (strain ATCC 700848 / DSM 11109 / ASRB2) TaxID=880072 RepID=F2NFP1_DESAR|nr:DUF296 domain-containing protein [Desulfobacca acetoxidans]AEB10160.1 hypothetical protein Desac_2338 [Desulfobacca acetoxidans DSM 11109]
MRVQEGRPGRLFLLTFQHGEDLIQEICQFAVRENIRAAWIQFLGALKQGRLVTGPEKPQLPPKPVWREFSQAWEVVGIGNLFWEDNAPKVHVHVALGKGDATIMGCLRLENEIYLVAEALLVELTGLNLCRRLDPDLGVSMLNSIDLKA